jgi:hypothetical protein
MPTTTLSDTAIFLVALDATVDESDVIALLAGRHVAPAKASRIFHALEERGFDLGQVPKLGRPALCHHDGPVATGRMSLADWGPHTFARRAHDDD